MSKKLAIIFVALYLILCGCGKEGAEKEIKQFAVGDSMVCIYYPSGREIVADYELYQLKQPDSISASVEELMGILSEKITGSVSYHTYMFDDENNLTLEFLADEKKLGKEEELLFKAAVAKTLFQLADMGNITMNISFSEGGEPVTSVYDKNSFYFLGYDEAMGLNQVSYRLYVKGESENKLKGKWVSDELSPEKSIVVHIIERLVKEDMIPDGTRVLSVSMGDDICYIKLSNDFSNLMTSMSSEMVLYSVVNSVASIDGINSVMIMIDGVSSGSYRGAVDITKPLCFNEEIIE